MDKYFEQFKNLEICDFRIDEISFKNFRGFEKENKISFLTNSKIPDSLGTEEVDWVKSKPKKYSKIIGIYGKNASGKTIAIDVISQISLFLSATEESDINLKTVNNLKPDFIGNLSSFILFTDDQPAVLAISISSLEIDFTYQLTIERTEKLSANKITKSLSDLDIHEKIIVQRFKGEGNNLNREIWNSKSYNDPSKHITNSLYFMKYLIDDNKYQKPAQRILNCFRLSILPINNLNRDKISIEKSIGNLLTQMVFKFDFDIKEINKLLTVAGNAANQNIEKIELVFKTGKFLKANSDEQCYFNVAMVNDKNVPLNMLSSGVLNFLWQFCWIYFVDFVVPKEVHKYILIDDLGSNWHSFLSTQFINLFKNDILENWTLFFTSHNPRLADGLRNDSIYIIDNEHQITRLTDTKIRNSEKFSNKYSNTNIDWFDTTPSLDNFDKLIDFFDEN